MDGRTRGARLVGTSPTFSQIERLVLEIRAERLASMARERRVFDGYCRLVEAVLDESRAQVLDVAS